MASTDPSRPNLVLVLTDDQGAWALGCAGDPDLRTPHLDGLAERGVRFTKFFCTSPVCSPARASLLTGQLPSQHGVHDWISYHHAGETGQDFLAGRTQFTEVLAGAGYRLGLSGKWHLGANDVPRPGFVHWYAHESGGGPYYGAPMFRDGVLEHDPRHLTELLAEDACAFVDAEAGRTPEGPEEPFALCLNFTAPHAPWAGQHPERWTDLYRGRELAGCPQPEEWHPWSYLDDGGVPLAAAGDPQESLIGYYASISAVDEAVGQLLGRLERHGLTESTLVVFTSDNGFNCGHHGIWGKGNGTFPQNMYDTSVTVPAIMAQPGRVPGGRTSDALVSAYDFFPTLVEHLGLDHPADPSLPGRSFADILAGGDGAADGGRERVVVFDEYGPVRMIRTREWKYVHRYPHGPHELYDLAGDPGETRNLFGSDEHAGRAADLAAELDRWFARYVEPEHDGARLPVTGSGQRERIRPGTGPGAFAPPYPGVRPVPYPPLGEA
ncbi:sulfatase [Mangrovactinospora gilvigrisea]|uniref:Sulfatase n=1 Tax=Mangrovactinospora gilvigrisea TaxID=1428644 RepID=A0A1J7BLK9_9ACTN|nr:sulfatase-like hydrolase/transferase [Mangrovactinospora gilvigrisea]OIV39542.1 sulfatase [Mangrovactinospora gilvigrisea]